MVGGLGILAAFFLAQSGLTSNIKVYREQGGARHVVASGGSLDVESGGELDIEAGGSLKLAGTAVSATAAELNLVAASAHDDEGLGPKRRARVVYDTAVDGGGIGAHLLGVSLPAKALITRSYLYVVTQFVDSGSGTVAVSCEDANNIKTATDITGTAAAGLIEGQSTGAASAFVGSIAATCEVTATVATASQTSGKALIFIEYEVVE